MGGPFPLITLLIAAVIGRHVVSATDCRESNCQFAVREECQNSQTVFCDMKDRPMKQINITATSFPRGVRDIKISDAEMFTFEPDAIASLTSLKAIEITNVSTLILLPRSLARDSETEQITVTIRSVKSLQLHPETFHGWRGDSTITIDGVNDCQMSERSMADAQLRILSLTSIQSLIVQENAFSADSMIKNIHMKNMKYISLTNGTFQAKVHWLLISDTENITIHSGALSQNATIQELSMERMTYLNIESDGIEAEIGELNLKNVAMETCDENTFGGNVASLSLSSSHISRTRKNCISAGHGIKKLTIERTHLNQIDESGIYGTVTEVQIKNSTFGAIGNEGLYLNVTRFAIEDSTIGEASEKAFVVLADSTITIRSCTFDVLQKGVFNSLNVKQVHRTAHPKIQLSNLHIKRPQNGSLQFGQDQRVRVHEVKTDMPCTCDIAPTLGLDMSSQHTFWASQPLCESKGVQPTLGHYLQEFCTEPTTIPPSKTFDELKYKDHQTNRDARDGSDEVIDMDLRPYSAARDQTSGDGSDQVHSSSTHNETLVATITVAVLIVLALLTLFLVRRRFRRKSRQCADKGQPSPDTSLHPQSNRQTHEPDPRPTISGPIQNYVPEPVHSTPYPTIIAETAETHYNYEAKPNKTWTGDCRESQTVHSPMEADGVHESNYDMTHDTENVTGETLHQEMTDLLDSPSSPVSAWTHTSCGPQQDGNWQNVYLAPPDAKMRANEALAQHPRHCHDSGCFTMTTSTTVSHDEVSQPLNEWYTAPICYSSDATGLSESIVRKTSVQSGEVFIYPDQQTCGPNLRLATSAPMHGDLMGTDRSGSHHALALSSLISSAVGGPAGTHTSNGMGTENISSHVVYLPLRASRPNETPGWSSGGPRPYVDIPIYYTAPRRVPEHRQTETRRRGGSQDEVIHRPDERYKLSASYRSDRPKDPRIQQLARDPRWARRYEKESEL